MPKYEWQGRMTDKSESSGAAVAETGTRRPADDGMPPSRVEDRRKIQNRLNQRARRQRIAEKQNASGAVRKWVIYTDPHSHTNNGPDRRQNISLHDTSVMVSRSPNKIKARLCELPVVERAAFLQRLHDVVSHNFLQRVLDSALLTSVAQHNMIRAMSLNASQLGLTMELLREDIDSPFNALQPWAINADALPPSLWPTALQQQVVHHPWIDLCPIPSIRDAMLRRAGTYDEDQLCHDLFIGTGAGDEKNIGMVIWGEAWDPTAFEISESIVRKWPWFAHDCRDVILSTNYWRAQRQRPPLRIIDISNGA